MPTWTITDTTTDETLTIDTDAEDFEEELLGFLDLPDTDDRIATATRALIDYLHAPHGQNAWAADYLDLTIEQDEGEEPLWTRILEQAPAHLTRERAETITRKRDAAQALTDTGGPDSDFIRLAYIQRIKGARAAQSVAQAAQTAWDQAPEGRKAASANKVLVAGFADTWQVARERVEAERQAIAEGRRIPGRLLQAVRTSMGLDQSELADALAVSLDTVRNWERGRTLINEGASADVWGMWREWLADTKARISSWDLMTLDKDEDLARMRVMLILADGDPVTLS